MTSQNDDKTPELHLVEPADANAPVAHPSTRPSVELAVYLLKELRREFEEARRSSELTSQAIEQRVDTLHAFVSAAGPRIEQLVARQESAFAANVTTHRHLVNLGASVEAVRSSIGSLYEQVGVLLRMGAEGQTRVSQVESETRNMAAAADEAHTEIFDIIGRHQKAIQEAEKQVASFNLGEVDKWETITSVKNRTPTLSEAVRAELTQAELKHAKENLAKLEESERWWKRHGIGVITSIIGPIITGLVVWYLTRR